MKKILIVEDDNTINNLIREILEKERYKIYSAYYCLSKIIWAYKFKDAALIKDMLRRAKQTVEDFDYFRSDKPIWYEEYKRKNLKKGEHEER